MSSQGRIIHKYKKKVELVDAIMVNLGFFFIIQYSSSLECIYPLIVKAASRISLGSTNIHHKGSKILILI